MAEVVARGSVVALPGWMAADGLSALMLALVSFVVALANVFAGGYMEHGCCCGDCAHGRLVSRD